MPPAALRGVIGGALTLDRRASTPRHAWPDPSMRPPPRSSQSREGRGGSAALPGSPPHLPMAGTTPPQSSPPPGLGLRFPPTQLMPVPWPSFDDDPPYLLLLRCSCCCSCCCCCCSCCGALASASASTIVVVVVVRRCDDNDGDLAVILAASAAVAAAVGDE